MKDIKVLVAAHKTYRMPSDDMYIPIHVGAAACAGGNSPLGSQYVRDDSGDNISAKNHSFCELTAVYWAWKNLRADYVGLVHYRRHFRGRLLGTKFGKILTAAQAQKLLDGCAVLLPKKRHYYVESNRSQYVHAHHAEGLLQTEKIISQYCPEYLQSFRTVMAKSSGHRFNMFIMRRDIFNDYCTWLFGVLFRVEQQLDITSWDKTEQRVFGYLAERLLDVWLLQNNITYRDIPYMFMEKQNWFAKIFTFLRRKFSH